MNKWIKSLATFGITAGLAFGIVAGAEAADKVRIGTEGAYPPFNQIDANGDLVGFDIDIAKALCTEMKVECEFVTQDWDGIIPGLLAKKYDAIIASMSITEERMKAVAFTDKYYSNALRLVAKKESGFDPAMMDGKTIGAQRATIAAQYLEDTMKSASPRLYDTQENAYLDLAAGRTDAVLADALVNYEWLRSDAGADFEFLGEAIDIDDKIGIAIRKGDTDLVAKFNAALKAILANGTYEKINAKYFPFSIY
ncbi:MAG: ABC transporter substrate-binding protein [Magnetovibrionaceae bacterium]